MPSTAAALPASPKPTTIGEKKLADFAPALPLPPDDKWKKDFGTADLTMGCVFGTAFVFLTLVDYSFDQYVWNNISPHSCHVGNPLIQALGKYYEWRLTGTPLLQYWDLFFAVMLPLIFFGLLKENFDTIRGKRAPIGRHILDIESLAQVVLVVGVIISKAKPTTERVVALINAGTTDGKTADAVLYGEITNLMNYHFIVFGLNALQWFVPFLRLIFQRKQDAIRIREATRASVAAAAEAAAAERAAVRAAKAQVPTFELMQARMEAAEAMSTGKPVPQQEEGIKKRSVAK